MPGMPPIERGSYLIECLLDIGPTMSGSMGSNPLTFGEIESWCSRTGVDLHPWETRFLRRLSMEYLSESHKAEKRDAKAPWEPVAYKPDLSAVAKSMQQTLLDLSNL